MKNLKEIAKNIHENLKGLDGYYVGTDNIWGLALAFSTNGTEEGYQEIVNHPQYGNGEALLAAHDEVYEEWFAYMEEHDMWPRVYSGVPEGWNFTEVLPENLH